MKYIIHLNSLEYVDDFMQLGINDYIIGCPQFSCRQAISLDYQEVKTLKTKLKGSLYVLVNALIEQRYLKDLEKHLKELGNLQVDGIIFQDFGVLNLVQKLGLKFTMVYQPDTLNTNHQTLKVLHQMGVDISFLAREIPLLEKQKIQQELQQPTMMQIHGVEYMAYSKRSLLSTYFEQHKIELKTSKTQNFTIQANNVEDACHIYEDQYGTHILTTKQIQTIEVLDQLNMFDYGYIESLYLTPKEYYEVVQLYCLARKDCQNKFSQLQQINPDYQYYDSFLFDQTVYKIADVRKRENDENNK